MSIRTATVTPDGLQMLLFDPRNGFVIAEFDGVTQRIKAWQSNEAAWPSPRKLPVPSDIAHWLFMSPVSFTSATGKSLNLKEVPALLPPRGLAIVGPAGPDESKHTEETKSDGEETGGSLSESDFELSDAKSDCSDSDVASVTSA